MDEEKTRVRTFIENRKSEREKLFLSSQSIYASFFADKRDIFVKLATVSATIGAFSFLLFGQTILRSPFLLMIGDLFLLGTIILSMYFHILLVQDDLSSYHKIYYDTFERLSDDIGEGYKALTGEIRGDQLKEWARIRVNTYEYKRPNVPNFRWHWMVYLIFFIALLLTFFSFFDPIKIW